MPCPTAAPPSLRLLRVQTPATARSRTACWPPLNSVAKLPYHWALDGISNTQTINPEALGHSEGERVENLVQVLDGYFDRVPTT